MAVAPWVVLLLLLSLLFEGLAEGAAFAPSGAAVVGFSLDDFALATDGTLAALADDFALGFLGIEIAALC